MTAQISDGFYFDNREYYEIAISKPIKFSPEDYGLHPVPPNTACWRGYWCDYEITKDAFTLKNLHIRDRDGKYPEINCVNAVRDDMGTFAYFGLDKKLSYTGNIILGGWLSATILCAHGFSVCMGLRGCERVCDQERSLSGNPGLQRADGRIQETD